MSTTRTADPIAAFMDAVADAEDAGCSDNEIANLQEIGDDIALFAARIADKLNKLSDGRMRTRHMGRGVQRSMVKFDSVTLAEQIAEAVAGDLDNYRLIETAIPLGNYAAAARAFRDAPPLTALENVVDFMGVRS